MDRQTRRLHHQRNALNGVATGTPSVAEGANGDISIRNVNGTIRLYAKYANRWYKVDLS